jgi:hypothetical protein
MLGTENGVRFPVLTPPVKESEAALTESESL